ncbi:MAG: 2-amino-4-hydroxy-6-hydroxymethyldihydropteridine diphosphokinase [Gammaproteobacteria bacterium]|nr:MAG: 2-amino-4-hydroxy-6-hydroxymethyldihydropteridine diphosphokinase [Gammaproteobacteria bacterium]
MPGVTGYIGIGSNLGTPLEQVSHAIHDLRSIPEIDVLRVSSLYRSKPLVLPGEDSSNHPDYINAVMEISTALPVEVLLTVLQGIELEYGRLRSSRRWEPRTLDLDILLYGGMTFESDRLVIPHPGIACRDFVLYPLKELCPQLIVPGHGRVEDLCRACENRGLQRLSIKP